MQSEYLDLLARSGLNKGELARRLDIHPTTVARWSNDAPKYALEYLRMYVHIKEAWERVK